MFLFDFVAFKKRIPPFRMSGWCVMLSPDKRPLKRPKKDAQNQKSSGSMPLAITYPDVYPQEKNQEEDKMTSDRLTNGYQLVVLPMEYDTLLKVKFNRFIFGTF